MGNCNGVIGYGKGKGNDFEDALSKAINNCKKNLIAINLDHMITWPRKVTETFQGIILTVEPAKNFNSWGHPTVLF
jgi:ribosomal protein S5